MNPRAWALFAAVSVLWGVPYLFIKIAVDGGISPIFLAWARVLLAAVLLLGLAWKTGTLKQIRGSLPWIALFAVIEVVLPFPLIGFGEQHVASSLTAILIASLPLIVAMLALRFEPSERVDRKRLVGLLIGISGVAALVGIDVVGNTDELIGAGAILLATLGYGIGSLMLNRKLVEFDRFAVLGGAFAVAAVLLTIPAALQAPGGDATAGAIASVVVLGVVCTAAAFVAFAELIKAIGPSRASVISYVNPVIAVALGITLLGERPGPGAIAGLLLILAGSWLATDGRLPARGRIRRRPQRQDS
jgi:drug/metabolite transporter (DMT)-like permease